MVPVLAGPSRGGRRCAQRQSVWTAEQSCAPQLVSGTRLYQGLVAAELRGQKVARSDHALVASGPLLGLLPGGGGRLLLAKAALQGVTAPCCTFLADAL